MRIPLVGLNKSTIIYFSRKDVRRRDLGKPFHHALSVSQSVIQGLVMLKHHAGCQRTDYWQFEGEGTSGWMLLAQFCIVFQPHQEEDGCACSVCDLSTHSSCVEVMFCPPAHDAAAADDAALPV